MASFSSRSARFRHYLPFLPLGIATILPSSISIWTSCDLDENCYVPYESSQQLSNWSSTHSRTVPKVYEPRSERELDRLLKYYQDKKIKLRPIGTALSPNGIALPDEGCDAVSVHNFHNIAVDPQQNIVRVGAGATVAEVLKELSKYGLTLENFSSIQEQQIAGWTQVAAHGTGCQLPTVEEQIIEMKLMTPNAGLLSLSKDNLPNVFKLAKVGLGSLGVVTELTMKCIPQLFLKEETKVYDHSGIIRGHYARLRDYRHVRYMWIPYTNVVVSVISNPTTLPRVVSMTESAQNLPAQKLIDIVKSSNPSDHSRDDFLKSQGFGSLRDLALGIDPLNLQVFIEIIPFSFTLSML